MIESNISEYAHEVPTIASLHSTTVPLASQEKLQAKKDENQVQIKYLLDNRSYNTYLDYLLKEQEKLTVAINYSRLLALLNQPVHMKWVREHETVQIKANGMWTPLKYLPIDKVKFLLNRIFGLGWKDEVVSYREVFNSVIVHLRLHYCIPGTTVWLSHDGIGAVGVQTDKDAKASDLQRIKADGVMKAAPAAASYALSNAAEKLGDQFGGNLNKPDAISFAGQWIPDEPKAQKTDNLKVAESAGKAFDNFVSTLATLNEEEEDLMSSNGHEQVESELEY